MKKDSDESWLCDMRYDFNIDQVMKHLRSKIFGQESAMQAVEDMLKVVKANITDPDMPLYVALFLGPTGVGKTETVKRLAEAIHGNHESCCRVDMNTLSLEHYAAALTGAPPGYVGSKEGSTILDKTRIEGSFSKPGIILFDEIEKASPSVIQTLLNIFDNGILNLASGEKTIDFRNTIIFMTSNIGAREIFEFVDKKFAPFIKRVIHFLNPNYWGKHDDGFLIKSIVKKNLESRLSPEFINRINDVIIFNWLDINVLNNLLDLLLAELNNRLKSHNCQLQLEKSAKDFLLKQGFDKHYGGRALKRAFRKHVEVPLASLLIEKPSKEKFITYIGKAHRDCLSLIKAKI